VGGMVGWPLMYWNIWTSSGKDFVTTAGEE